MTSATSSPHWGFGPDVPTISYCSLLRFSSWRNKLLLILGWTVSIFAGGIIPLLNINFGIMIDIYAQYDNLSDFHHHLLQLPSNETSSVNCSEGHSQIPEVREFHKHSFTIAFFILAIGFVYFFLCYFFAYTLDSVAARIVHRIRVAYYECLLQQEISWHDDKFPLLMSHQIEKDLSIMEDGIGSEAGCFLCILSTSVCSLLTAVWFGWELTFILLALTPLFGVISSILAGCHGKRCQKAIKSNQHVNFVGMQLIRLVKTVFSFSGQMKSLIRFERDTKKEEKASIRLTLTLSLAHGLLWLANYLTYALGVWYGSKLIIVSRETAEVTSDYTIGRIIIIFWNVLSLNYYSARTGPFLDLFKKARTSGSFVYRFIDRESHSHTRGMRPNQLESRICFDRVCLSVQSRDVTVRLKNLSFTLQKGETVSILPSPHSVNNEAISLIPLLFTRFLEQDSGQILLGDLDIRQLNLQWLRSNVGYVGKTPVIFDGTIHDNIWMAEKGSARQDVEEVAKVTNCMSFIEALSPSKFETAIEGGEMSLGKQDMLDDSGSPVKLTVSQQQKINLAKAILKKPLFLILDRVTASLGEHGGKKSKALQEDDDMTDIQVVIERIRLGKTTLIISDCISTNVKNSDRILVLGEDGEIVEEGSHDDLMSRRGIYRQMVSNAFLSSSSCSNSMYCKSPSSSSPSSNEPFTCNTTSATSPPTDPVPSTGRSKRNTRDSINLSRERFQTKEEKVKGVGGDERGRIVFNEATIPEDTTMTDKEESEGKDGKTEKDREKEGLTTKQYFLFSPSLSTLLNEKKVDLDDDEKGKDSRLVRAKENKNVDSTEATDRKTDDRMEKKMDSTTAAGRGASHESNKEGKGKKKNVGFAEEVQITGEEEEDGQAENVNSNNNAEEETTTGYHTPSRRQKESSSPYIRLQSFTYLSPSYPPSPPPIPPIPLIPMGGKDRNVSKENARENVNEEKSLSLGREGEEGKMQKDDDKFPSAKGDENNNNDNCRRVDIDEHRNEDGYRESENAMESDFARQRERRASSFLSTHYGHKYSFGRLSKLMQGDTVFILAGCLFSALLGLAVPAYAVIVGHFMTVLESTNSDQVLAHTKSIATAFVILSICVAICATASSYFFGVASARLTRRLKAACLKSILSQDLSWIEDDDDNCLESVRRNIFNESDTVSTSITSRMSSLSQTAGTIIACIILALYIHWKMGMVVLSLMPFVMFRSMLTSKGTSEEDSKDKRKDVVEMEGEYDDEVSEDKRDKLTKRVISSIKSSSCLQHQAGQFRSIFGNVLKRQLSSREGILHMKSQSLGVIQSIPVIAYGIVFIFGSYFIQEKMLHYTDFFIIVEGVLFGSILVSEGSLFTTNFGDTKKRVGHLFHIIDSTFDRKMDGVDIESPFIPDDCGGSVSFSHVDYHASVVPFHDVLEDFSLTVRKGEHVAILDNDNRGMRYVLPCLLLKLYDVYHGLISIDGVDISTINTTWIRSRIGLLSRKEMTKLFNLSIADNISFGDNSRYVSFDEIVMSARRAGIHDYIQTLPMGYDTIATTNSFVNDDNESVICRDDIEGRKAVYVPTWVRLRITIARLFIQDPSILLMDDIDWTDSQGLEDVVRDLIKGKTVISFPSPSLLNDCPTLYDRIVVVDSGTVLEEGKSHQELMDMKGLYYSLFYSLPSSLAK